MDLQTLTNLGRFKDIIFILLKHGFGDLVDRMELPGWARTGKVRVNNRRSTYERIRLAMEELGPTFIKVGQILSLRPDLIPPQMIVELEKLQDQVAAVDFDLIRPVAEKALGKTIEEAFPVFDMEPVASASLSQVYRASLTPEGPAVAVKIQRPGIVSMVRTDLNILAAVADRIHQRFDELSTYNLPKLVRLSRHTLLRELDFLKEARYMKVAEAYMSTQPYIYIPKVYEDYSAPPLLVMEFIHGTKLKDLSRKDFDDPAELSRRGLRAGIKQLFRDGFFHADPHPGNLMLAEDGKLCLIDWGMVGRLTDDERFDLIDLVSAVVDKDSTRLTRAVLRVSIRKDENTDRRSLERELMDILDLYHSVPIRKLNLGNLLLDITYAMREHGLIIPTDLAVMIKALITLEGVARQIYPELDVVSEAGPYIKDISSRRYNPIAMWRSLSSDLLELFNARGHIPRRLGRIIRKIDRGEIGIRFEHHNLEDLEDTLEHTFNRLTFGIIIGAIVIGSSMIITTGVKPHLFGYPALGVIGYIVSGVLGLWLVFNIIRKRHY